MVLCNLTVEAGAKAGIVEPDEKVVEYCKAHGREAVHMFKSDEDAHFCEVYDYDLSKIEPVVVRPDFVDNFAYNNRKSDVNRITIKNSGKRLRNNCLNSKCF